MWKSVITEQLYYLSGTHNTVCESAGDMPSLLLREAALVQTLLLFQSRSPGDK